MTTLPVQKQALEPMEMELNTMYLFSPCTYGVNLAASRCENGKVQSFIHCGEFISRPIDHLLQACFNPFLRFAYCFYFVAASKSIPAGVLRAVVLPLTVPLVVLSAIARSAIKVVGVAIALLLPLQALYAIKYGKQATQEYFAWRAHIADNAGVLNLLPQPADVDTSNSWIKLQAIPADPGQAAKIDRENKMMQLKAWFLFS